jgi:serine/threonine-protein kinase
MKWLERLQKAPWYVRGGVYLASFLLVCGVSAAITFSVFIKIIKVEVPNVEGRNLGQAMELLENVGLKLRVDHEVHDINVPAGYVIEQEVTAGSRVKGESEVGIVLSTGAEVKLIPSVTGLSLEDALAVFREEGLVFSTVIEVHSEEVPEGQVIAQRPAPEEWTGETITLIASAGPHDIIYYAPSFRGMSRDDALLLAAELELEARVRETGGGEYVTFQRPEPGTELKAGSPIYLELGGF